MSNISFFTPIDYQNHSKDLTTKFRQNVDDYFYLGGKRAYVLSNMRNKVILSPGHISTCRKVIKVISYTFVLIPVIMLALKLALRCTQHFHTFDPKEELEKGMDVSKKTILRIQSLIPEILKGKESLNYTLISKNDNIVFQLTE